MSRETRIQKLKGMLRKASIDAYSLAIAVRDLQYLIDEIDDEIRVMQGMRRFGDIPEKSDDV